MECAIFCIFVHKTIVIMIDYQGAVYFCDLNMFASNLCFSRINSSFASYGNAWLTALQTTTDFTQILTHTTVFLQHLIDKNLFLFLLMTQLVLDDSHTFLYKKGSEFKPFGITLSCIFIAWGAVGRQLPHPRHKTQRGLPWLHEEHVLIRFN